MNLEKEIFLINDTLIKSIEVLNKINDKLISLWLWQDIGIHLFSSETLDMFTLTNCEITSNKKISISSHFEDVETEEIDFKKLMDLHNLDKCAVIDWISEFCYDFWIILREDKAFSKIVDYIAKFRDSKEDWDWSFECAINNVISNWKDKTLEMWIIEAFEYLLSDGFLN